MARKKKNDPDNRPAPEFNHSPFKDLKGLSLSAPPKAVVPSPKAPPAEPPPEKEPDFVETMKALGIRPLTGDARGIPPVAKAAPPPAPLRKEQSDEELFLDALGAIDRRFSDELPEEGEEEEGSRAEPRRMRQVRRGTLDPTAELDLHGLHVEEALAKVRWFLEDSVHQGHVAVVVVTGAGRHSGGEAVLRPRVEGFLDGDGRRWVAEWGRAPRKFGGDGAQIVFLRKKNGP